MKISTLEMIHETLKNEYEMARVSYTNALKETASCERVLADAADENPSVDEEKNLD